jgi:TonB family protein
MFGLYHILLRKESSFVHNRIILISILLLPILMNFSPNFWVIESEVPTIILPEILLNTDQINTSKGLSFNFWWLFYGLGVFVQISIAIYQIHQIGKMIHLAQKKKEYWESEKREAFCFWKWIVIGKQLPQKEVILAHEKIHKQAFHSLDLSILMLLRTFFWFVPIWNWVEKLLKENHEFYVDQKILEQFSYTDYLQVFAKSAHIPTKEMQRSLVNSHFTNFKKRIFMMKKEKTTSLWKTGLVAFSVIGLLGVNAISCETPEIENHRQEEASEAEYAHLPTTDNYQKVNAEIMQQISTGFKYPEAAKKRGDSGKIFIQFVITKEGTSKNLKVLRAKWDQGQENVPELLEAGKEMVRKLKVTPLTVDGNPVAVKYVLPINFKLKEKPKKE